MKTLQEIFDHVTTALLLQNRRSTSDGHNCVYRAPNGDKCAAGHCVDDAHYDLRFEGRRLPCPFPDMEGVHKQFVEAFASSGVDLHDAHVYSLLASLQRIHDSRHPDFWRENFTAIAKHHNLQVKFEATNPIQSTPQ